MIASYCVPVYFVVFLPLVVLAYQVVPQRHRWKLLLAADYAFFFAISGKLLVFLLLSTVSIHHIGLWLGTFQTERDLAVKGAERSERKAIKAAYQAKTRGVLTLGILFHVGLLLVLKYADFFGGNVNHLLTALGLSWQIPTFAFAMPIGISFYTMQAVSYLVDVYRGTVKPDRSLARLALYMSFFPALIEGPICRYSDTADQIWEGRPVTYHNLTFGAQRILYGLFKKIVIADRLNPLILAVFSNPAKYDGGVIALAMVCYTCQLYMEFSGTMDVVIGSGEIFGVTLPENFRHPFFSKSISEFWTRWHITLGTWFKDYIFYPVSLSAPLKKLTANARKKLGNHFGPVLASGIALFCVWFCNGLWHGSAWNYIFFGLYHFVLIFAGNFFEPTNKWVLGKLHIDRQSLPWRSWQVLRTIVLVNFGELFFRATRLRTGLSMFRRIFTKFTLASFRNGDFLVSIDRKDLIVVIAGVLLVLTFSILQERGRSIRETAARQKLPVRWLCYYAFILLIVIFGAYGKAYTPVDPIYAGF